MSKCILSEKMKAFCHEYVKNGGNITDAYMVAYDGNSKQAAVREGSKLLLRADIQSYLKDLNKPVLKAVQTQVISEREKKRTVLWDIINSPDSSPSDICRAMDILNKMDSEYININHNVNTDDSSIQEIDTNTLKLLAQ